MLFQYPAEAPKYSVQLPAKFDLHWTPKSNLDHAYSQFAAAVDTYKELWDLLGEIDDNTWVLEPDKPTFNATYRRIAVSKEFFCAVKHLYCKKYN